jgi:hypothetical protein
LAGLPDEDLDCSLSENWLLNLYLRSPEPVQEIPSRLHLEHVGFVSSHCSSNQSYFRFTQNTLRVTYFLFLFSTLHACSPGWYPWHRELRIWMLNLETDSNNQKRRRTSMMSRWLGNLPFMSHYSPIQEFTDGKLKHSLVKSLSKLQRSVAPILVSSYGKAPVLVSNYGSVPDIATARGSNDSSRRS